MLFFSFLPLQVENLVAELRPKSHLFALDFVGKDTLILVGLWVVLNQPELPDLTLCCINFS